MFGDEKGIPVDTIFEDSFSREVWQSTYKDYRDTSVDDTMMRVARYVASAENTPELRQEWSEKFYEMLSDFKCTAGGRIYANAGTEFNGTTLMNCVSGDTLILTDKGIFSAETLKGKIVNVLTQEGKFQPVNWKFLGEQQLMRITFSNGEIIRATPDHEWIVTMPKGGTEKVKTKDLLSRRIPLNGISNYQYSSIEEYENGIKNGLVFGDGYVYTDFSKGEKYSAVQQFGDSRHLILDHFGWLKVTRYKGDNEGIHYVNGLDKELKNIPSLEKSTDYLRGFMAGLIASDGCIDNRGSVVLHTSDYDYALKIKDIAVRCGLPVISLKMERDVSPFDETKKSQLWKMTFVKKYFQEDENLILKNTHKEKMRNSPKSYTLTTIKCVSVEETNSIESVYCCNEPTTHSFTLGGFGLITGNCFVSPRGTYDIDSLPEIINDVLNQCQTLKSEGGWGQNFSWIRPRGSFIHGIGVETPGAVKYMEIYDKTSDVITSGSGKKSKNGKAKGKIRKGAMMSVLDCWHPDVIEFITAKQQPGRLTKFNVSVNCTDEFMYKISMIRNLSQTLQDLKDGKTIEHNGVVVEPTENNIEMHEKLLKKADEWHLRFPETTHVKYKEEWDGNLKNWESKGYPTHVYRTVSAIWLWNLILESTYKRAEPGVLFLDRANHFGPLSYFETISATNPCLIKGTLVNTPQGYTPVENLKCGDEINTVLGSEKIEEIEINENVQTYKICFSDGGEQIATASHQYHAFNNDSKKGAEKRITLIKVKDLSVGDSIRVEPTSFSSENFDLDEYNKGLKIGILLGDGCYTEKTMERGGMKIASNINDIEYNDKVKALFGDIYNADNISSNSKSMSLNIKKEYQKKILNELKINSCYSHEKYINFSIVNNYSIGIGVLDGLLATDGNINFTSNNPQIRFFTSSPKLAEDIRRLLLYYGAHGRSHIVSKKGAHDGGLINGRQIQRNHDKYQISITGNSVKSYFNHTKLNNIHKKKYNQLKHMVINSRLTGNNWVANIVSIEPYEISDVYDLYASGSDTWITSGYVQRGCGEQTLAPGGVCNLGSINLTQFLDEENNNFNLDKIKKYVRYLTRFLDNINSLSTAPLDQYVDSMRNKRRIGIGILGWGSALFMLKVRFGSDKANRLRDEVMSTIAREAYMSSIDLATEKCMFEYCIPEKHAEGVFVNSLELPTEYMDKLRETGIRNSSLLSIQPTGNTSIFANVVSGGLEPVFMPEYVRTVIVNEMPEHITDVTPKWYEGEWHETEMFKFVKEGDEEILKGTDSNGIIYKIDKNRGLTKEVLCEDYGVRWLKARNEWDPDAEWAVTTTNLTVDDHVNDLTGFARWVDSAMSKTVNVPYNYPFEEFKDIYLDSYNSGYVKGVTTYRSGTMATVLSAKEEKTSQKYDEEIIEEDVKLTSQMPAMMNVIRSEGRKWYLTTIMNEQHTRPVAFFVHTNNHEKTVTTHDAVDRLIQLAYDKGIPEKWIKDTEQKIEKDPNATKIARAISLNLRHGVLIKNVVATLDRVDVTVGTFLFQIKKYLATFIKDGEKVDGEKCLECQSESIVFSEGCKKCMSCGSSKCG